jgi:hypothetical protein
MRLITATERLAAARNKDTLCILGPYGVGKTSLLYTLPEEDTLCVDFEGGLKSVQTWRGDVLSPETFDEMIEVATLIGGPKMGLRPNETMGVEHHAFLVGEKYKGFDLSKYRRVFTDSITRMMESAWDYARRQPGSFAVRRDGSMVDDTRGTYGELGRVAVSLLKHMQRTPGVDIIFVGLLDRREDEAHRIVFEPQMMGGMTARELPGIVDHVISMVRMDFPDALTPVFNWENGEHRVFVCRKVNPWALPAKTRCEEFVGMIEEPHLGRLLEKINQPARAGFDRLRSALPQVKAAE